MKIVGPWLKIHSYGTTYYRKILGGDQFSISKSFNKKWYIFGIHNRYGYSSIEKAMSIADKSIKNQGYDFFSVEEFEKLEILI